LKFVERKSRHELHKNKTKDRHKTFKQRKPGAQRFKGRQEALFTDSKAPAPRLNFSHETLFLNVFVAVRLAWRYYAAGKPCRLQV